MPMLVFAQERLAPRIQQIAALQKNRLGLVSMRSFRRALAAIVTVRRPLVAVAAMLSMT